MAKKKVLEARIKVSREMLAALDLTIVIDFQKFDLTSDNINDLEEWLYNTRSNQAELLARFTQDWHLIGLQYQLAEKLMNTIRNLDAVINYDSPGDRCLMEVPAEDAVKVLVLSPTDKSGSSSRSVRQMPVS